MIRVIYREKERQTCGAWMPYAKDHCARTPGHAYEHRSTYSLDNALQARRVRPSEEVPTVPPKRVWRCPACGRPAS
jgi:hypothetical protein